MPETILPSVKLVLKTVSQSGEQVAISASVSVPPKPTYLVYQDNSNITSYETVIFSIQTEYLPNGTELFWEAILNDIEAESFVETTMEGFVVIAENSASVMKTTIYLDNTVSRNAYIYLNVFSDSEKQILVARSTKVTIYYLSNESW